MKNIKQILIAFLLTFTNTVNVFAITDTKIFTDPVQNIYEGTQDAKATIPNLRFNDINGHWAKEDIIKAGAFNMVKGYDKSYRPNGTVSNQEALAFVLRAINLEAQAQAEGERLKAQANSTSVLPIWSIGYLSLARTNGLITNAQYADATNSNQQDLPPDAFKRDASATREQIATWLVNAINIVSPVPLSSDEQQSIYNYSDWKNISSEHINSVEILLDNNIMTGNDKKMFNPKGSITRAEMAKVLANLDEIYNNIYGYLKKTGTVAGIKDNQLSQTGSATLERNIHIRTNDGKVDILKYQMESSTSPQAINKDAVVYNDTVSGLSSLREGNEIEYIIKPLDNTVRYVNVKNKNVAQKEAFGKLSSIDYLTGLVKIIDNKGKTFDYYAIEGLVGTDAGGDFAFIDDKKRLKKDIPFGESVNLITKNNIITKINYVGTPTLDVEIRGVVVENNPQFSYITIINNKGQKVTKNYYEDDITVEKQPYYSTGNDVGYLDEMFPNFTFDPSDTTIDKIEAGDIVFIRTKADEPNYIDKISASPNYAMKYGKVSNITRNLESAEILVELNNGQVSSYTVPNGIFISKGGKPSSISEIVAGDWVKLLVNEAILSPGETMEAIKEVIIEPSGHLIGELIQGRVGTIDTIQKNISVTNSYAIGKTGLEDFKQVRKLSIDNKNIQYYYDGKRIDLDFVQKYLKRSDGDIYVALEKNYAGDVISKATFRTGRGEELTPDIVVNSDNMGTFSLAGYGTLYTDAGSIIRKNGKLVEPSSIEVNDYVKVVLNGNGKVAIADIYEAPNNEQINIARGRVSAIEEGRSFTVDTMSQLSGNSWTYSPVSRKFTIDGDTLFITKDGVQNIDKFIGVTEQTQIGKAFTILYKGSKATHIIDMPYTTKAVSGTIYSTTEGLVLKDGKFINEQGSWEVVGIKDSSLKLKTEPNTIVIKGNKVVSPNSLQKGDLVRVLTETLPEKITGGTEINARIIFVGN